MSIQQHSTESLCYFEVSVDNTFNQPLTDTLGKVIIKNSIKNVYGIFQLVFHVDNQLFITRNLYGQNIIKLGIKYSDINGNAKPDDSIEVELIILEVNLPLTPKSYDNITNHKDNQQRIVVMTCIPKIAYEIMSTAVNRLWDEEISLFDAVKQLCKDAGAMSNCNVEECGKNCSTLDQLLVPPMSLNKALDDLNNRYGIFENEMFKYVRYDGKFEMWDILKHYKTNLDGEVYIHKIPTYAPDILIDTPHEYANQFKNHFVTYDTVETLNLTNDYLIKNGCLQTYIYHPEYDIAHYINVDVSGSVTDHGIIHKSKDIKMQQTMKQRLVVDDSLIGITKEPHGNQIKNNPIDRRVNQQLMSLNKLKFTLIRQLKIKELMKVGHVLYFKPYAEHEVFKGSNYEGAYLILDSEITLSRMKGSQLTDQVDSKALIVASRTNQSYN